VNWLLQIARRRQMRDDLDEEIREHLRDKSEELMRDGLPQAEAERQARIALGNPVIVKERSDEVWLWSLAATFIADVRYASRQLCRNWGFTVATTLTLMLGIGANLAIFNVLDALLLESLPVHDPDSLVYLAAQNGMGAFGNPDAPINLNLPIIDLIGRRAESFEGVLGWTGHDFTLDERGNIRTFPGALVSGNAFGVLGLKPAAGRLLDTQDDRPGGSPGGWAAVISYGFWQEHYGGSPNVVGEHIKLSDQSVTIVGVAPRGFDSVELDNHPALYLPLEFDVATQGERSVLHSAGAMWLTTLARLKPDVSRAQAAAEMNVLWPGILDTVIPAKMRHVPFIEKMRVNVFPGRTGWSYLRLAYTRPLLILQGMVALLFLLCCANLAGLCLARAFARRQEFAIRGALGAARTRVLRQVLIESLVLALPGALLSLLFAWQAARVLAPMMNLGGMQLKLHFDPWLFLGAPAFACLAAVLFGILPAWFATRFAPSPVKANGAGQKNSSVADRIAGGLFLPLQIAVSLVLVIAAGLLTATLVHLRADNLGFGTQNVYLVGADFGKLELSREQLLRLERNLVDRIRQMPGITNSSIAMVTPLNGSLASANFVALSGTAQSRNPIQLDTNEIAPAFFAGLGTPILEGRDFAGSAGDADGCIVNKSAARKLFGSEQMIGRTVRVFQNQVNGDVRTHDCLVIGEVGDAKYDTLRGEPPATVYLPMGQGVRAPATPTLILRARSASEARYAFTQAMNELGHGATRGEIIPFAQQVDRSAQRERMLALLANFFAVLALLLSAVGVFGVMAWSAARRTAEIGVRMALGATRGLIIRHFLGRALRVAFVGLIAGLGGTWLATKSLHSLLYGVAAMDPMIIVSSVLGLVVTVALAAFVPARRAASIEPMQALRQE
jgi:predicted permease